MTFSDNNRLMRQPLENGCAGREAEATTTEISREQNPQTFAENRSVAREGGEVAGNARKDIEERTGRPVITSRNAEDFSNLISEIIEKDYSEKEGK